MTAVMLVRVAIAVCLLASACSSDQTSEAAPDPSWSVAKASLQEYESSDPVAEPADIDETSKAGEIQAIGIDVVGALFPTSSADKDSWVDLYSVFGRVMYLHYIECMGEAGFEIDPLEDKTDGFHNRYFDFPDLEAIAEQGFSNTYMESDPLEDVPLELHDQYRKDDRDCILAYVDPSDQIRDASNALSSQWSNELRSIESSAEIVEQFEIWAQCMTDGGRPVESHRGFFADLEGALFPLMDSLDPADWEGARAEELAAAELYVACMRPLEEVRQPMRDDARRKFLEDNAEEVRAIEELANRLILEVQQQ